MVSASFLSWFEVSNTTGVVKVIPETCLLQIGCVFNFEKVVGTRWVAYIWRVQNFKADFVSWCLLSIKKTVLNFKHMHQRHNQQEISYPCKNHSSSTYNKVQLLNVCYKASNSHHTYLEPWFPGNLGSRIMIVCHGFSKIYIIEITSATVLQSPTNKAWLAKLCRVQRIRMASIFEACSLR